MDRDKKDEGKYVMKVLDPGHTYSLDQLDTDGTKYLKFVKRVGDKFPGNTTAYPGVNMQEVMRAMIDRCKYLYDQDNCVETGDVLELLRLCIFKLERRAASRHGRQLSFDYWWAIEERSTCDKCGHIECEGLCHPSAKELVV